MHCISLKCVKGRLMNIHEVRNTLIRVNSTHVQRALETHTKRNRNANSQDKYVRFSVSTPNFIGIYISMRKSAVYKNHNSPLPILGVFALCYLSY